MDIRKSKTYQSFKQVDDVILKMSKEKNMILSIETRWLCLDIAYHVLNEKHAYKSEKMAKYAKEALDVYKQDISWG